MAIIKRQVLNALSRLFRIVEAGERGYATAATNANSRGLKLLFKSYAQQRANFKEEILAELMRLGGNYTPRSSILGAVHRGRVAIFAAMTIEDDGREKVVLKEAAFGEGFADRSYRKTLEVDLPPETRALVERQYAEVTKVIEQIHLMLGKEGKIMVVRLFDSEQTADAALQSLKVAGIQSESVEKVPMDASMLLYKGRGTTTLETIFSGAFGGTLWGILIGVLAAFGAVQSSISEILGVSSTLGTWILIAISTTVLAAIVGGIIGLIIGLGLSEDDTYVYRRSIQQGKCLVKAVVDSSQAGEASMILDRAIKAPSQPAVSLPG